MEQRSRKMLDRGLTGFSLLAVVFLGGALLFLLGPLVVQGWRAFCFVGTIEHRRMLLTHFRRGKPAEIAAETQQAMQARTPVYRMLADFEQEIAAWEPERRREILPQYRDVKKLVYKLLGPPPDAPKPILLRDQYGETRWEQARATLQVLCFEETWDYSSPDRRGVRILRPRQEAFAGTSLQPLFAYVEEHLQKMHLPKRTFYAAFLADESLDAHFFGGIRAEMVGTLYLAVGAMIFAVPFGVLAAIFLAEFAGDNVFVRVVRTCVNTLAGVPSIVFGLFGLAFFINTLHVSTSKSVLAGALTLSIMVLPTIIRASEEALLAVPHTYREAALSLGATPWQALTSVILPAALPGILTGIILALGRAAGETAPIIFTAAVSVGRSLLPLQALRHPTPALSWNLYNLATEHASADELRHVQYGMALTLVVLVLVLNLTAIWLRGRVGRRLRA